MKTSLFFALMAVLSFTAQSFASTKPIKFQVFTYAAQASEILNLVQQGLGQKAVEACGGREKVNFLGEIKLDIKSSRNDGSVGKMAFGEESFNLDLIYPKITSTSVVDCRD